jgi:hypothetical protein
MADGFGRREAPEEAVQETVRKQSRQRRGGRYRLRLPPRTGSAADSSIAWRGVKLVFVMWTSSIRSTRWARGWRVTGVTSR